MSKKRKKMLKMRMKVYRKLIFLLRLSRIRRISRQQATKNLKKSHSHRMKGMQLRKLRRQQAWRRSLRTQKMF